MPGLEVLRNGDAGYDAARRVWNAMVDHRPALVVRCRTASDVATAVVLARAEGLEIGVRCGGHGIVGHAVPDGGLMIDLTPLRAVRVDPGERRAVVQGGALLGALDRASQEYGLAVTAGNVSHTGVGGLTLGGGARYNGQLTRGYDGAVGTPAYAEAYWVFDTMAAWQINKNLDLQLNIYNLLDKQYVASINKSGYRYLPGVERSARLSANLRF